ncbi:MAG: helix-turn-helix domain-containing protein [Pseudomonadota bacterium]
MRAADFVQSYFDAWNHSDPNAVVDHLDQGGVYCDIPANERHSGDDLIANLEDFFALEHNHYDLVGEVLATETTIAFQYMMSPVDENGEVRFGAEFMTLDGNGVVSIADYYDVAVRDHNYGAKSAAPKYAKSGLDDAQLACYRDKLLELMESQKIFLQADLTMPKLATQVDCSVNHLSQAINSGFSKSFFDFLNGYRIEEAMKLLSAGATQSQAILDISFSVGFNSNSAFYAAFKKATGKTPAQYRKEQVAGL